MLDDRVVRESALLLAYLGYQTGDERAVYEGLDAFEARAKKDAEASTPQQGGAMDVRLGELLKRQWIRGGSGDE
ncbi:MAG: hypothetical protein R3B49_10650 [Phycisphaerales bacterium]